MKAASGCENATDLTQRLLPLIRSEMVEHEGGEHSIKGRVGTWQYIRKALIELDRDCPSFRHSSASCKRLRIGIIDSTVLRKHHRNGESVSNSSTVPDPIPTVGDSANT